MALLVVTIDRFDYSFVFSVVVSLVVVSAGFVHVTNDSLIGKFRENYLHKSEHLEWQRQGLFIKPLCGILYGTSRKYVQGWKVPNL